MIRIADLYAGIGGIRLGFEQAFGKKMLIAFSRAKSINMLLLLTTQILAIKTSSLT